jgi:hypothetical protein
VATQPDRHLCRGPRRHRGQARSRLTTRHNLPIVSGPDAAVPTDCGESTAVPQTPVDRKDDRNRQGVGQERLRIISCGHEPADRRMEARLPTAFSYTMAPAECLISDFRP